MQNSLLTQEALETPERVAEQLEENEHAIEKLGSHLKIMQPRFIYMVGRGSSDHATGFAKYLFETETGVPVVGAAPSVTSIYGQKLNLEKALVLVVSQSGRSPDIVEQAKMARESGAYVVAIVNDENSPLADEIDVILPLKAGEQQAVGATKTYLATLSALLQLAATWSHNKALKKQILQLPEYLRQAIDQPALLTPEDFNQVEHCAILGRGFSFAVAKEIALKLKGLCAIHAEPFSTAEFLHSAAGLTEQNIKVFNTVIEDESYSSHMQQINKLTEHQHQVRNIQSQLKDIPVRLQPLTLLQRFYLDLTPIAASRGIDINHPPGLQKITKTV
ncbi:glutamine--fructose-6-phosphate transaminase (isomerizing) [Catenovulum agarivorans DS-2]|uniref:Glutamine--fructose-6-phosphate transaminase (Isomerizing) n=1 Tax=Catenovulum agarivorans DS-2 TaxID=1328313 RepID=W7QFE8_9ALTE|nr:SIS domain-containing protein [Catenovulum agarivorans]EWH10631.1 glutamine--fructose-6-phosphate transaminase (isomerizing) [Catenovulum agarivorans DS-2]